MIVSSSLSMSFFWFEISWCQTLLKYLFGRLDDFSSGWYMTCFSTCVFFFSRFISLLFDVNELMYPSDQKDGMCESSWHMLPCIHTSLHPPIHPPIHPSLPSHLLTHRPTYRLHTYMLDMSDTYLYMRDLHTRRNIVSGVQCSSSMLWYAAYPKASQRLHF